MNKIIDKIIDFIYIVFDIFFRITTSIRNKILSIENKKEEKKEINVAVEVILIFLILISFVFKSYIWFAILATILFFIFIIEDIKKMIRSVRFFFKLSGIIYIYSICLIITGIMMIFPTFPTLDENIQSICIIIISLFTWIFISCIVETKVSRLSNTILTGMNGIVLALWNYLNLYKIELLWNKLNFGIEYEKINLLIRTFFLFTTIILGITTMICAIKEYWENKNLEKR